MSGNSTKKLEVKNNFTIPKWASKPPSGLHLDVMKDTKMIQKLMIDEKKCYFFGRNKDCCDFVIDHASCSRVHAVLLWHKDLNRSFLIDLNSTHGTFIGSIQLEPNKPQQVFVDSELKFGASTRTYIIRERPQINKHFPSMLTSSLTNSANNNNNSNNNSFNDSRDDKDDSANISVLNLPESEAELDNLTEFNTAHNKRVAQLVDMSATTGNLGVSGPALVKRRKKTVSFYEDEIIINPEDIDPSIGRFRNMVHTTVIIPNKKKRPNQAQFNNQNIDLIAKRLRQEESLVFTHKIKSEEEEDEEESQEGESVHNESSTLYEDYDTFGMSMASNMGLKGLDLAPDVDSYYSPSEITALKQQQQPPQPQQQPKHSPQTTTTTICGKKIYAKEAWPGRKPQTNEIIISTIQKPTSQQQQQQPSPAKALAAIHSPPHHIPLLSSILANPPPPPPPNPPASSQPSSVPKRLII